MLLRRSALLPLLILLIAPLAGDSLPKRTSAARPIVEVDLPLRMIPTGDGHLVSTSSGYAEHALTAIDIKSRRVTGSLIFPSLWYGLAVDAQHSFLVASSGHSLYIIPWRQGHFGIYRELPLPGCKLPAGVAVSADSKSAYVACNQSHNLQQIRLSDGALMHAQAAGEYPYAIIELPKERLAVANWGSENITILAGADLAVLATIRVGSHPTDMVQTGEDTLAVACSDSDAISFVSLRAFREIARANLSAGPLRGLQPDALAYDGTHRRLLVALAGADAVASLHATPNRPEKFQFDGVIPTDPDPTSLVLEAGTLFIAYGHSSTPGPSVASSGGKATPVYIGRLLGGGIEAVDSASIAQRKSLAPLASRIYESTQKPTREQLKRISAFSGSRSPIRYVFYVIKENRTYDQVLGDMSGADGDARLTAYGEDVTPNHHALAREFILFDRFFTNSYVSADGHLWSTAAVSTEYVNKLWPINYSLRAPNVLDAPYDGDAEHDVPAAAPGSGFLWDRAARLKVSFRNYGEWNVEDENEPKKNRNYLRNLKHNTDLAYLDSIGTVTDQERIREWTREFRQFEKDGNLPRLTILHLPNDHTEGTRTGARTPEAMLADNDLALGQLVETISKSRYWPQSAIFVLEDDAQDGPDHVDARRSILFAISPYTRQHAVNHEIFNTVSVIKAIGQVLGLGSLTYFDDRAASVLSAFSTHPDLGPYKLLPARVNLELRNTPDAPGSKVSNSLDFSKPDHVPPGIMNWILAAANRQYKSAH